MTNKNPRTQDLIDFIKSKYNIDAALNIFNTKNTNNKITIATNLIDNLPSDYFILELLNGQMKLNDIKNNTNSTKFLTFILNPNTSISFIDMNENGDEKKTDNNSNKDKDKEELVSVREEIKRYKLISYILGVITLITIIVIIYLLFIK